MKRCALIAALLLISALSTAVRATETPWETIEWGRMTDVQKFKWAVDLYKMDRAGDAAEVLKRVVDAKPSARDVAEMRDALDPVMRTAMLADAKTTKEIQAWLDLYAVSLETLRHDDAYVGEWAAKVNSADGTEADAASRRLEQLQEYGAAGVCRMMAQSQVASQRAAGRSMLLRLGRNATLPVVECLSSPDDSLKLVMLDVLGGLKDVRAQAAIVRLVKVAGTSEPVRKAANEALARIQHQPRPALPLSNQPPVNYWWLADATLHERAFTLCEIDAATLPVWSWDVAKNTLTCRLVPRKLYNEALAKEACFDGLALDKTDTSLRAMVIACCYSEKLELLGEKSETVDRALDMALLVGGKLALQQCMDKALLDGDLGIAVQAADALAEVGAGKGFTPAEGMKTTNPLLAGLASEDRAVRFVSARAVVACQPKVEAGDFDNSREVLPALAWGLLYELPGKTVLIIHPDAGVVNHYKGIVRKLGHETLEAADVGAGAQFAGMLPRPDVVLIANEFAGDIPALQGTLGSSRIPFVELVSENATDVKFASPVISVLEGKASEESVRLALARALDVPEKKIVKDLVPRISARAAESLAEIVPAGSVLAVKTAVPALRCALASRDDEVRIPTLKALGNFAAADSSLEVLAVAANTGNPKPVRLAALDALAKILEAQDAVPPDVFAGLVPVTAESDAAVSLAAARAVAVAKFDPAQFTDLMVLKRVQEIKSGKAE